MGVGSRSGDSGTEEACGPVSMSSARSSRPLCRRAASPRVALATSGSRASTRCRGDGRARRPWRREDAGVGRREPPLRNGAAHLLEDLAMQRFREHVEARAERRFRGGGRWGRGMTGTSLIVKTGSFRLYLIAASLPLSTENAPAARPLIREHRGFARHADQQCQAHERDSALRPHDGLRDPRSALGLHIALLIDGRPDLHADAFWPRIRPSLLHGSAASRMSRTQGQATGRPAPSPISMRWYGAVGSTTRQLSLRVMAFGKGGVVGVGGGGGGGGGGPRNIFDDVEDEAEADGPLHRPHLSRPLVADPPSQQAELKRRP